MLIVDIATSETDHANRISIIWMNTAEYKKKSEIKPKKAYDEDYKRRYSEREDNVLINEIKANRVLKKNKDYLRKWKL